MAGSGPQAAAALYVPSGGGGEWEEWEPTGGPREPPTPTHTHTHARCAPRRALMADYGNEEDQPEDQTSFNTETELNNTDATCAFKCLFEGLIVLSRGFFLLSFPPSFFFFPPSFTSQSSPCLQ